MTDEARPPAKKGGRPRSPEPLVTVSTWIPARDYDRIVQAAKAQDTTVSAIVRTLLRLRLK